MTRKRLIILRHGEAEQINKDVPEDFYRPLTSNGMNEVVATAQKVAPSLVYPILIVASAAKRTQQTAEIFSAETGQQPIQLKRSLFHARPDDWMRELHATQETVLTQVFVGHNPTVSELCTRLANEHISLETGACCLFEAEGEWKELSESDWRLISIP